MQASRWKFIALWQLCGMLGVLIVGASLAVGVNLRQGSDITAAVARLPYDLIWLIALVVMITPLSLLVLWAWTAIVAKYPDLEGSLSATLLSLSLCAIVLAVAAGVISNWEVLRFASHRDTFIADVASVAKAVLLWALIGVVLPRLLVPRLRPPSLFGRSS